VLRASLLSLAVLSLLPATAHATGSGGALAGPVARSVTGSPATVAPGAKVSFAYRATRGARVRVDLLAPGRAATRVRLGVVGSRRKVTSKWTAALPTGKYTARLVVSGAGVTRYLRAPLTVVAPPPPTPTPTPASLTATAGSKVFPVQGPYSLGGADARFGAGRTGHTHQGQDIVADEGLPVVTPVAGIVHWIAYQANGAGHYVVVRGDDGRHYVFMHLQAGSTAVTKNATVAAGQRVGAVGSTGASSGPHLHFEIWVNGWWATKASAPIDPLPELLAWATG
jgi:murein DD-endopeptidase MepM/ murein hydrolase activator NlpD